MLNMATSEPHKNATFGRDALRQGSEIHSRILDYDVHRKRECGSLYALKFGKISVDLYRFHHYHLRYSCNDQTSTVIQSIFLINHVKIHLGEGYTHISFTFYSSKTPLYQYFGSSYFVLFPLLAKGVKRQMKKKQGLLQIATFTISVHKCAMFREVHSIT